MKVEPYLNFNGRCEEAIEFYKSAIGATVQMLMRFKESPELPPSGQFAPEVLDKVMHASLTIGDSRIMVSDGRNEGATSFSGITLSITASTDAEVKQMFEALSVGGHVTMPLSKTFYSSSFGMLTDRFGVSWMVLVQG